MGINLMAGAQTVAPAMGRTVLASIRKKKEDTELPTDDPGYRETLGLMRQLLAFCALSTVDNIQPITNAWIPHPPSVLINSIDIPPSFYPEAARHIQQNLGPKRLNEIGKVWWQWRKPGSVVRAEWVEMKADYLSRQSSHNPGNKVMFYIHGGAYFLGGIGHRPQIQRHARKLKGRVFAPRYRLAPQFPFPCAVQDVLSAYLYLLTIQKPETIVFGGDSAGGGLCVALLLILRDQGLPLPAGASLISPWVDLTHSFPSITIPTELDYVPSHGFHAKPSLSWPPPNAEEMKALNWPIHPGAEPDIELEIDGENVILKEQFQMYAQNSHLVCPLISGVLAPSLGGLCPLQVIVGGAEVLRDEQIYLAHKAADPEAYPPSNEILLRNNNTMEDVGKYPPTDVQLLVFDNCPHAAPTLGHTTGAKYQYRSVAQFAAWALSRAQRKNIDLQDDASIHSFTGEYSCSEEREEIGKAGDPLPAFKEHMIRQRVDRFGYLFPLRPASELRACLVPKESVGFPKAEAMRGWLDYRRKEDLKFARRREKVFQQRLRDTQIGFERFPDGEIPPPSALAGRRVIGRRIETEKPRGKVGRGIYTIFFGKFDQDITHTQSENSGPPWKEDRRRTVIYEARNPGA